MKSMKLALVFVTGFASVFAMETDGVPFKNEEHVSFYSESFAELENVGQEEFEGFGEMITVTTRPFAAASEHSGDDDESSQDADSETETYQATRSTKWGTLSIKEDEQDHKLFPYEFEFNGTVHIIYLSTQSEAGHFFAYILNKNEVCCKLTYEALEEMTTTEAAVVSGNQPSSSKGCFIL